MNLNGSILQPAESGAARSGFGRSGVDIDRGLSIRYKDRARPQHLSSIAFQRLQRNGRTPSLNPWGFLQHEESRCLEKPLSVAIS